MKTICSKFKKEKIAALPRVLFPGRIEVVQSEGEARRAVEVLRKCDIIGLDTETRPCFQSRRQNQVALLQISSREVCFLFRLNMIGLPDEVVALLADEEVLKVGLSLQDDFRSLRHLREFQPAGYVELQDFVKPFGIQDLSLQKLYANLLSGRISKGQQLSNWEASVLSDAQKGYAATDAWACICLYEELQRMRTEGYLVKYEPDEVPEPQVVTVAKPVEEAPKRVKREKKPTEPAPIEQPTKPAEQPAKPRRKPSSKRKTKRNVPRQTPETQVTTPASQPETEGSFMRKLVNRIIGK